MCSKSGCGIFWGIFLILFAAVALGLPWYYVVTNAVTPLEDCTMVNLLGWKDGYCSTSGCASVACDKTTYDWRKTGMCAASGCPKTADVYDTTMALTIVSSGCALFTAIGLFIRGCSYSYRGKSVIHILIAFVGLFASIVSIVYFAIKLPKSLKDDQACNTSFHTTYCDEFYGSSETQLNSLMKATLKYGGAGWLAGIVLSVTFIIALIPTMSVYAPKNGGGMEQPINLSTPVTSAPHY